MRPFLTRLFEELRKKYPTQVSNHEPTRDNWRQIHEYKGDSILLSFQLRPPGPLRLEWTLQKGGADALSVLHESESEIKKDLGHGEGQNVVFDFVPSANRAKFHLDYSGGDSTEDALINWAVSMYGKFMETLEKYAD